MEHQHQKEYASKGAAYSLGTIGTVLGGLAFLGEGGLLGGRRGGFGWGHGEEGHHGRVDRFELLQSEKIACLEAKNATLEAARYTDNKIAEQACRISRLEVEVARNEQAFRDFRCETGEEFKEVNCRLDQITKVVVPLSVICPPAAPAP